jgi:hypothetical protein
MPDDTWALIERCWAENSQARPHMAEVVHYLELRQSYYLPPPPVPRQLAL